jgi:hypothetical protein
MKCQSCEDKGFIEYNTARDGGLKAAVRQCHSCKDITKYSAEIKRRHSMKAAQPLTQNLGQLIKLSKRVEE